MKARNTLLIFLLVLVSALPGPGMRLAAAQVPEPWTLTCVDCAPHFEELTDRALRFDALGRPHVAYGGGWLYYGVRIDGVWQIEVVDVNPQVGYSAAPPVGNYAALALDAQGRPHISYFDDGNYELRYAYRDATGWHLETVDSPVGHRHTSISVDSLGFAHIAYFGANELRYASQDSAGWHLETADAAPGSGSMTSIALDTQGRPHIAYETSSPSYSYEVRYATRNGSGWQVEILNQGSQRLSQPSLAVDALGGVHISCHESLDGDLIYASRDGSGWQTETVDDAGEVGMGSSLVLGSNGQPRISYWVDAPVSGQSEVRYATWDGASWQVEVARGGIHDPLARISLALSPMDEPCLAHLQGSGYGHPKPFMLVCQQPGSVGWVVETIDAEAVIGQEGSLAVDSQGQAHLVYTRQEGLTYAYQSEEPAAPMGMGVTGHLAPGWQRELVDAQGTAPLLVLDPGDTPHLAYLDEDTGELRYGVRGPSGWQTERVDAEATGHSLVLDFEGKPTIGYSSAGGLRIARRDAASWQVQVVDVPGGSAVALVLLDGGETRLAYIDGWTVRFAYQAGGVWYSQVVDVTGPGTAGVSLILDGQGIPYVSYLDAMYFDSTLQIARWDPAGWQVGPVTWIPAGMSQKTALAFDSQGNLHTANFFYDGGLFYATLGPDGWQIEDIPPYIGARFLGMALDPWDRPFIAYHDLDHTQGLMLLAHEPEPAQVWLPLLVQ